MLGYLVEVQVGFKVERVARNEYVFLPKLRAVCIFDRVVEQVRSAAKSSQSNKNSHLQDYNAAAILMLSKRPTSPLTKVKRKVGYNDSVEEEDTHLGMKKLCLDLSATETQTTPSEMNVD